MPLVNDLSPGTSSLAVFGVLLSRRAKAGKSWRRCHGVGTNPGVFARIELRQQGAANFNQSQTTNEKRGELKGMTFATAFN